MENKKNKSIKIQNSGSFGAFYSIRGVSREPHPLSRKINDGILRFTSMPAIEHLALNQSTHKKYFELDKEDIKQINTLMSNIPYYAYPTRTQISLSIEKTIDREDPYFPIRQNADTCLSSSRYRMMKLYQSFLKTYYGINFHRNSDIQTRYKSKSTATLYWYMYLLHLDNEGLFHCIENIGMFYADQAKYLKRLVADIYNFVPDLELKGLTCPLILRNNMTSWSLF